MDGRRYGVLLVSACLSLSGVALGAVSQGTGSDEAPPSVIEEAVIEHRCNAAPGAARPETDRYEDCLKRELASLRADFGADLTRLPPEARTAIDAGCSKFSAAGDRDAYIRCLDRQLAKLPSTRRDERAAGAAPIAAVPTAPTSSVTPTASRIVSIGGALAALALVGVAAAVARSRGRGQAPAAARECRTCGRNVPDGGDLCPDCRHQAAEARRRAARERANAWQTAPESEESRGVPGPERPGLQVGAAAAAPEGPGPLAPQQPIGTGAMPDDAAWNPHAVLGVSPGATRGEIEAAYEAARAKYDAQHVAHLGAELQDHYRAKARDVERAFEELTRTGAVS